jgi:hypothetical protein
MTSMFIPYKPMKNNFHTTIIVELWSMKFVMMMWIQKDFISKTWQKQNKIMTKIHTQIGVEQTEGNVRFYLYLYSLGT